jgi:hypothetical protein
MKKELCNDVSLFSTRGHGVLEWMGNRSSTDLKQNALVEFYMLEYGSR